MSFILAAKDGGKWDLKSDNVKLADHVGHTVKKLWAWGTNATAHGIKEDVKTGVDKKAAETGEYHSHGLEYGQ